MKLLSKLGIAPFAALVSAVVFPASAQLSVDAPPSEEMANSRVDLEEVAEEIQL